MSDRAAQSKDGLFLPTVVSSRTLYEGKIVTLKVDDITLPYGGTTVREVVEHPGAVVIAALDHEGYVYMVRQYRHPIRQNLLELPAGGLEPDEEPLAAAKRELREEVGIEAEHWTSLGCFYSSPGFANECLHAFLARELTQVESDPDDDEELIVVRYPLEVLYRRREELTDAKTLATLLLVRGTVEDGLARPCT
jgi:ADP-ribose pyrophosphatase